MDKYLVRRNSYFRDDGIRVIERKYSCGLKTRELDYTKQDWYIKLINIKTKECENKSTRKSHKRSNRR